MDPFFLIFIRTSIAGILALLLIGCFKGKRLLASQLFSMVIVSGGVVISFPLLTAIALQHVTSAHLIVFLGLLLLSTTIFGVIRGAERPRPAFWEFSVLGSLLVVGFTFSQNMSISLTGDLLMLIAAVVCGMGHAEGSVLSRGLGGWQVISWALIISLPFMLFGFFFWYKGLAIGGIAAVG